MIKKFMAAAAVLAGMMATSASAALVTVDGDAFNVSTVTGTFSALDALLEAQPWWQNQTYTALEFAEATGTVFGIVNSYDGGTRQTGPFFAGSTATTGFGLPAVTGNTWNYTSDTPGVGGFFELQSETFVFAVATPAGPPAAIPLPASAVMLLSALGIVAVRRRRAG